MKNLKIEIPDGYIIDREKSTFENIVFKKIKNKLPLSVNEIPNRLYYIDNFGAVCKSVNCKTENHVSSEKRAKAFLALIQLVELRDAWNRKWKADWINESLKFCINLRDNNLVVESYVYTSHCLNFKTEELAEKFLTQFKDLIKEARELL